MIRCRRVFEDDLVASDVERERSERERFIIAFEIVIADDARRREIRVHLSERLAARVVAQLVRARHNGAERRNAKVRAEIGVGYSKRPAQQQTTTANTGENEIMGKNSSQT